MNFQVGETIGDYEIVGVLGRGGMGKVFRVRNQISDRIEAMKIVLPDLEGDRELAERFLREIKVHATLDHPNIARLRTALRIDNRIVMILELVDGASLDEILDRGPIPKADAIRYGGQILSALGYAHSLGIIHRDLKPANIIVNKAGLVKLTDFGIAHTIGAPKLTRPGLAFGSLYYMSPEQFGARAVDARSDLYSLGITLFEMLTGTRPIEGDSEYSIMKAHVEKVPVPPADMDPELAAILLKSLSKEPERRFQSAEEFRTALESFGRGALPQTSRTAERANADVASSLDPAVLARVEAYLLPALGPIAKHLVTKVARQSTTVAELYKKLAEQIPQQREREAFLKSGGVEVESTASVSKSTTAPAPGWDAAVLKTAKQQLAAYIGPIASIVVERAARRAHNLRDLYEALATEIPTQRDREKFLKTIGHG